VSAIYPGISASLWRAIIEMSGEEVHGRGVAVYQDDIWKEITGGLKDYTTHCPYITYFYSNVEGMSGSGRFHEATRYHPEQENSVFCERRGEAGTLQGMGCTQWREFRRKRGIYRR
jgi:hypothetical protein